MHSAFSAQGCSYRCAAGLGQALDHDLVATRLSALDQVLKGGLIHG